MAVKRWKSCEVVQSWYMELAKYEKIDKSDGGETLKELRNGTKLAHGDSKYEILASFKHLIYIFSCISYYCNSTWTSFLYVMLCSVVILMYFILFRCVTLCYVILFYYVLYYFMLFNLVMLLYVKLCYVTTYYVLFCYLFYFTLLSCFMLCSII